MHNNSNPNDCEYENVFDFKKANYDDIRIALSTTNWQYLLNNQENMECSVEIFYITIMKVIQDNVPLTKKRCKYNSKNPVWFNRHIINLKNRKQNAHKSYKKFNNQ